MRTRAETDTENRKLKIMFVVECIFFVLLASLLVLSHTGAIRMGKKASAVTETTNEKKTADQILAETDHVLADTYAMLITGDFTDKSGEKYCFTSDGKFSSSDGTGTYAVTQNSDGCVLSIASSGKVTGDYSLEFNENGNPVITKDGTSVELEEQ